MWVATTSFFQSFPCSTSSGGASGAGGGGLLGGKSLLGGVKKNRGKKAAAAAADGGAGAPAAGTPAAQAAPAPAGQANKRTLVPAGRVVGSDEVCTVTLADMLSVLERDKMYCKSELLYRWLNKAARTTAGS